MLVKEALAELEKVHEMLEEEDRDKDLKYLVLEKKAFGSDTLNRIRKGFFNIPQ